MNNALARPFHFTPLQTFEEPELGSMYEAGLHYTVRAGEKYDKLEGFVVKWLEEGKVKAFDSGAKTQPSDLSTGDAAVKGSFQTNP
jgi:hypothetical protein